MTNPVLFAIGVVRIAYVRTHMHVRVRDHDGADTSKRFK